MKLLGAYNSRLPVWHTQELLRVLEAGLVLGEYGGGKLFDKAASDALLLQGQDFSSLPAISAGTRAVAEAVNFPLSMLNSRYDAIVAERTDFLARMELFLSVLEQDSGSVDRLLYAAEMEAWAAVIPQVSGAIKYGYDLSSTHGAAATGVSTVDPFTGVSYVDALGAERQPIDVSYLIEGNLVHGIGVPVESVVRTLPISLRWSFDTAGEVENLAGSDWTKLSALTPDPLLQFDPPLASVVLPKSRAGDQILQVRGRQSAGNLPVYVKIIFVPRRVKIALSTCEDQVAQPLSRYRVSKDDIIVYDNLQSYEQDQDYEVSLAEGRQDFIPRAPLDGKNVFAQVTESFPAYQCSINNQDWSPSVLFDADNPFADVQRDFFPVSIVDGWFPVVDELGSSMGIEIKPFSRLDFEALLRIETRASANFGAVAVLEIEFDRPGYYNGLRLTPFVNMPVRLQKIQAEGMLTHDNNPLFQGSMLIDRPVSVRFTDPTGSPVYVRRLFLTLYQPNYSLKEHMVNPSDQLRQESLARLQSVLPFSNRSVQASLPTRKVGAQYEFGLRDIAAEKYTPAAPGVFISGPFPIDGPPEIVRLDFEGHGTVECYLISRPATADSPIADHVIQQLTSGVAISFMDAWPGSGPHPGVNLFLKWVFRSNDAVLTRFLLQVSKGI